MSYVQKFLYELNKGERNAQHLLDLENQVEKINQIDLTSNYSQDLVNLIAQLDETQQYKLKKIIYQNNNLDAKSQKKYENCKKDEHGNIHYRFKTGQIITSGMITADSVKFAKPYELETLNEFEKSNQFNVNLPLELKVYLACVSSSVFKNHLKYQILKLTTIYNMPTIVNGVKYYRETTLDDVDDNDPNYKTLKAKKDTTLVLKIRECGCGYSDLIVLNNGNNFGEIWHEKFAGDGMFFKVNDSFFDYVLTIESN